MKRTLIAIIAALVAFTVTSVAATSVAATATCSNSYPADGHGGPWYTSSNQAVHGNTVKVSCPSGGTAWKINYIVFASNGSTLDEVINQIRSGSGSAQFSFSVNPVSCHSGWNYWTYVHNYYTGGNISKPSSHVNVIC